MTKILTKNSFFKVIGLTAVVFTAVFFLPISAEATAPIFNTFGGIRATAGSDITVTLPAHATNDIMPLLGWVRDQDDTVAITTATGWAQVGTGCTSACSASWSRGSTSRYWLFWKRAISSSETDPVFNKSGSNGNTYVAVITYGGAITSGNPWDVLGTASTGTTDPTTITGITTLSHESLIVVPVGGEDNNNASIITTGTDPATYAEHYVESSTGSDGTITFSEAEKTTIGATGNISVDWNTGNPVGWGGVVLSLKPVPVTTLGNGTNSSNVNIAPGASAIDLDSFTLQTNTGSDTVTAATVTLSGGSSGGLSLVSITNDAVHYYLFTTRLILIKLTHVQERNG